MPKIEQLISVKVSDKGRLDDRRRIVFEVTAPADLFNLSDMLVREGALKRFRQPVANALRAALVDYIRAGRALIKTIGKRNKNDL